MSLTVCFTKFMPHTRGDHGQLLDLGVPHSQTNPMMLWDSGQGDMLMNDGWWAHRCNDGFQRWVLTISLMMVLRGFGIFQGREETRYKLFWCLLFSDAFGSRTHVAHSQTCFGTQWQFYVPINFTRWSHLHLSASWTIVDMMLQYQKSGVDTRTCVLIQVSARFHR